MIFRVDITLRAERDFARLFEEIDAGSSATARKWYAGLEKAVLSLDQLTGRCPKTREDAQCRHLLYGRKPNVYRVIFRIPAKERRVEVLHIRHAARGGLNKSRMD